MHNGSLTSLREVVKHYSELDEERLHSDGERILKPLHLTEAESGDMVAFLESLSPQAPIAIQEDPPPIRECLLPDGISGMPRARQQQ
jgi:cytochrome c peroxidase